MSSSDDISLSRYFKTILNETRIFFDRNTTKTAVRISRLVNAGQPRYHVCEVTIPIWRWEL